MTNETAVKIPFYQEFSALHAALGLKYDSDFKDINLFNYDDMDKCPDEVPPFRTNFYQIFFIYSSNLKGNYNDTKLLFGSKNAYLLFTCPGKLISWQKEGDLHGYIFSFKLSFMLQLFTPETFSRKFNFFNPDQNFLLELAPNNDVALIVGLFKKIEEEYKGGLSSNYEVICHYVSILLIQASRLFSASTGLDTTTSLKNGKAALLKAFETEVRKNLRARKQVKDYAKVLNVTAKYLSEAVKSESGKTARKVIQEIIMLEARSLLLQTSLTVTEISHRLGFSDPSHFTKMFKSKTGSTPSYFIKKK